MELRRVARLFALHRLRGIGIPGSFRRHEYFATSYASKSCEYPNVADQFSAPNRWDGFKALRECWLSHLEASRCHVEKCSHAGNLETLCCCQSRTDPRADDGLTHAKSEQPQCWQRFARLVHGSAESRYMGKKWIDANPSLTGMSLGALMAKKGALFPSRASFFVCGCGSIIALKTSGKFQ